MATNITIENADGTQLVIPEAGSKRRSEINIHSNHRFFKVTDNQGETRWFLKDYKLNNEGITVKGMETPRQGAWALFYEYNGDASQRFSNHNNLFSFYAAIMTLDGDADAWKKMLYDYNHSMLIDNLNNADDSKIDLQNVYGQTFNGMKMLPSSGGQKRIYTGYWRNWNNYKRKKIVNMYIDNDDIFTNIVLINFYNNIQVLRDRIKWWDGSNWQETVLSTTIPHQQWFQIEIDYENFTNGYTRGKKPTYLKVNGEEIDIASQNVADGRNEYIYLAYGRSEKDSDYVKYSTLVQIPTGRIEELRGTEAKDEIVTIVKNLITPV